MSPATANPEGATPTPASPGHPQGGAAWAWALTACVLLGASGAVRAMQERRHDSERSYKEACPIDLKKIPGKFGDDWKLIKGGERTLDELTMRITGGSDHIIRTYANDTGVIVTALVLFGPAEPVLPHTPQVCYPSSGFEQGDVPSLRTITFPLGEEDVRGRPAEGRADFLSASYAKPNGRQMLREAVFHSFRLDGQWSPFIGSGRKFPRRNPGIFKVQVQRLVGDGEKVDQDDPIVQFLRHFLAELESEIQAAGKAAAGEKTVVAN